jgi:hypothetical protein
MEKAKLGPWHRAGVKPVHVGVYQVRVIYEPASGAYAYWNGQRWGLRSWREGTERTDAEAIQRADADRASFWEAKQVSWRGLLR